MSVRIFCTCGTEITQEISLWDRKTRTIPIVPASNKNPEADMASTHTAGDEAPRRCRSARGWSGPWSSAAGCRPRRRARSINESRVPALENPAAQRFSKSSRLRKYSSRAISPRA